ncbi:hypothetical protein CH300_27905 [Rhodococcus sp. 15-1154-1]|nr:carboxymuconolactone decarboxylase family protein [Rhodococcus sp. 15-1154-1]OZE96797.1 hypothetical protein CH300_27905 [Rhodococcus sp. 15-1154-1]
MTVSQQQVDTQAARLLKGVPDGDGLTEIQVALIQFALRATSSSLDTLGSRRWAERAVAAGATFDQLHEIVTLQSSVGVHAFFESSRALASAARPEGGWPPLDEQRQHLWDKHIGGTKYWTTMQEEIPGFLESLLRMSPEAFEGFITYCGLPFRAQLVPNITKELISMASDAATAHRYLPGMRMHLRNAVRMGAGRAAIDHALRLGAESPSFIGVE